MVWSAVAIKDREMIFDYIEADSFSAAVLVDDRIEAAVELLADTPEIGRPGRVEGTRELMISRTQYIAAYALAGNQVTILRVLHGALVWPDVLG